MQTINVRTTQNVFITYTVASIGDRIAAFFIDLLILIAYLLITAYIIDALEIDSLPVIYLVFVFPYLLYHLLFEIFMNGQSPGKRQMNIKVVRMDGTPPTIGNYVIRWLLRFVDISLFLGMGAVLTMAINGKGQRIGDILAGTTVVRLSTPQASTSRSVFTVAEDDYIPTFSQVTQLSDQDIELIKQALVINKDSGNNKPVMAVSDKVKQVLGITTDMPPVKFLYTVLKDYSHLTSR